MRLPGPRILRLLPLVALVGVDGFVLFAPYLILMLSVAYMLKQIRSSQPQPADVESTVGQPAVA